ncbi:MAG: mechanosensitive ion channel family protein [Candidatus Longimicrobiales bacterium M2_2A_002]
MDFFQDFELSSFMPFLLDLVGAIVLVFLTLWAARWAKRITTRSLERGGMEETLTRFTGTLARYAVLILGGLTVLSVFGISVASFAAILAAAGFALGLALQGTLGNFSAGAMLLIFRPFKVGDVISLGGTTAKVVEIELFTTQLDTPDNRRIIMPNGEIFGSTIENITFHENRRVDVDVGTGYEADLRETRAVLDEVAANVEGAIEDPAPQVYLQELGGSSINWTVRVWAPTGDYWAVKERLTHSIKIALDDAGIGIPYPQMDIHVDGALSGSGPTA